jgi:hypothetical protein
MVSYIFRSLSFVFVTSGCGFVLIAFVYVLVDVKHWWGGEPFFFAGIHIFMQFMVLFVFNGFINRNEFHRSLLGSFFCVADDAFPLHRGSDEHSLGQFDRIPMGNVSLAFGGIHFV